MFHKDILSSVSISINELKRSFAVFKLSLNSCFISVKHCTNHMVIAELIIHIDRDETEIKWWIAGGVLSDRSHTSVQINNGSVRGFGCIVIGHGKKIRWSHIERLQQL